MPYTMDQATIWMTPEINGRSITVSRTVTRVQSQQPGASFLTHSTPEASPQEGSELVEWCLPSAWFWQRSP